MFTPSQQQYKVQDCESQSYVHSTNHRIHDFDVFSDGAKSHEPVEN